MVRAGYLAGILSAALLVAAGAPVTAGEMAEIVPRADDISLNLTIENIDGKPVNVPETVIRQIPPGDHYLGVKIEFRSVSGGSLITGLGAFSAISGAVSDKPAVHEGVSFTAEPGKRYLLNGAMEDGKPKLWVEEESYDQGQSQDDIR
ncbi:MAG: hypothetical protein GWM90_22410 [Gemmatimonadetes bacterium]|nr:hypothetical protein [Gemmatimonadota bacterium]NIQ58587.1 hypothetical protein [Gemmatimonadota bacterium]NIU78777.1 hypothetical protein [Gammaproteobacteria bacterium]NIX46735.1 hypothetical protein [Gemmatimonadota bacterium]